MPTRAHGGQSALTGITQISQLSRSKSSSLKSRKRTKISNRSFGWLSVTQGVSRRHHESVVPSAILDLQNVSVSENVVIGIVIVGRSRKAPKARATAKVAMAMAKTPSGSSVSRSE